MPEYRYLYASALTDTIIGELPLESVAFGEVLNGPGALTATMPLDPRLTDDTPDPTLTPTSLEPGKVALYVERDGVIVWGGLLWARSVNMASETLTLAAQGFWSLVRRRRLASTKVYAGVDQALIVKDLLDTAQASGSMGLVTSTIATTGVPRDRTYYGWERQNVGELVEALAEVENGLDFRVTPRWSGSSIVREVFVARKGGRETGIVLDTDANCELQDYAEDGTSLAVSATLKGAGEADAALITTAVNAPLLGVYPLLETLEARTDVIRTSTLLEHAATALARGSVPMATASVVIYPGSDPGLGSFIPGDRVRLVARHGLLSVDRPFRITSWQHAVATDGSERTMLTLAPLEVF